MKHESRSVVRRLMLAFVSMASLTCAEPLKLGDVLLRPTSMSAVGQSAFNATAGSVVQQPVRVRVLDQFDEVLANQPVVFSASGGTLSSQTVSTDAQGIASFQSWTAANLTGAYSITASIPSSSVSPVAFAATVTAAPPATMSIQNPGTMNNQGALVSTAVPVPPAVTVRDQYNNLVPGISVTFAPASGSGSVVGSPAISNSSGVATLGSWTLGSGIGSQQLVASVASQSSVTTSFTARAFPAPLMNFNMNLPPAAWDGAFLGFSSTDRGYAVDVTPLTNASPSLTIKIEPEFDGIQKFWSDVLRLGTIAADPPSSVNVLVYDASVLPVATTGAATLAPAVPSTITLGSSSSNRGYIVEVTPAPNNNLGGGASIDSIMVRPEWNGTSWNDVLRLVTTASTAAMDVAIRAYETSALAVATQFNTTLQPGVLHGFTVGPSSLRGAYIVEVSPVSSVAAVFQVIRVQPEWNGTTWFDVVRIQTRNQDPTIDVQVRVWRMGDP